MGNERTQLGPHALALMALLDRASHDPPPPKVVPAPSVNPHAIEVAVGRRVFPTIAAAAIGCGVSRCTMLRRSKSAPVVGGRRVVELSDFPSRPSSVRIEVGSRVYPSINAAARALGVWRNSVCYAARHGGTVKGTRVHLVGTPLVWPAHKGRRPWSPKPLPVVCVTTGAEYDSIASASKFNSISYASILRSCHLKRPTRDGLDWRFKDEQAIGGKR